jgi:hypothetical protein
VRRHWHTEEFGKMIDAIVASRAEVRALSIYGIQDEPQSWINSPVASESG